MTAGVSALSPARGYVCLGIWKQTGPCTFKLIPDLHVEVARRTGIVVD